MSSVAVRSPAAPGFQSTARPLPHLPIEILRQIASYLDVPTAARLARTCRALRDAGEMKIWERVDVTSGYDPTDPHPFYVDTHDIRQSRVTDLITSRLAALTAHALRIDCVQHLTIEPSLTNVESLLSLLRLLASTLRSLTIIPLPVDSYDVNVERHSVRPFYTQLRDTPLSFPRLVTLRCSLKDYASESLVAILHDVPNLERLELNSVEEELAYTTQGAADWPPMPKLKVLTIEDMDQPWESMLVGILSHAPNLQSITLAGEWAPYKRDQAMIFLRNMPKVKELVWLCGPDNLTGPTLRQMKALESLAQGYEFLDEADEWCLQDLALPQHPTLTKCCLLTGPRLDPSDYASLGVSVPPTPLPTLRLGPRTPLVIDRAPALTQVQLLPDDDWYALRPLYIRPHQPNYRSDDPVFFTPPSEWEIGGSRGYLVRTYTQQQEVWQRPLNHRTLYHVRSLTRARQHSGGSSFVGARRTWQDHTHYRGRTVPIGVLDKTYAASGLEREWLEPGRSMELSKEAWEILEAWREDLLVQAATRGPEFDLSTDEDEDDDFDEEDILGEGDVDMDGDDSSLDDGTVDMDGMGGMLGLGHGLALEFGDLVEEMGWGSGGEGDGEGDGDGWETEDSEDPLGLFVNADPEQ